MRERERCPVLDKNFKRTLWQWRSSRDEYKQPRGVDCVCVLGQMGEGEKGFQTEVLAPTLTLPVVGIESKINRGNIMVSSARGEQPVIGTVA